MNEAEKLSEYPELKRLAALETEKSRIESILREYVSGKEAARAARRLFDWAEELDDIAAEIQNDPVVRREFNYDGKIFSHKDPERVGFFVSYDGLSLLESLTERNTSGFFEPYGAAENNGAGTGMFGRIKRIIFKLSRARSRSPARPEAKEKTGGAAEMLGWIKNNFFDVAKVRLENLKETGSMALIPPEAIKEIIAEIKEREKEKNPPSPPKDGFWDFYEREMAEYKKRQTGEGEQPPYKFD